jgi:RNA 3'-terminal phosphate cyclase (ATP)
MQDFIKIDGSFGEGGGQIIRSSLTFSLITGKPFVIEHIRARRQKPGLMRQHLTAVNAAATISGAEVEGATVGSTRLSFQPGPVKPGEYAFRVGTAGSTTLVFQTILPALMIADGPSQLTLEGGTHNPFAPPFDFLARAFLPLINQLGPKIEAQLVHPGFYPAGGGRWTCRITPSKHFAPLELIERGKIVAHRIRAMVSRLPRHIAERECKTIQEKTGWDPACFTVDEVRDSPGPGNAVMIEVKAEHVTAIFTAFGQIGVKAKDVARKALRAAQDYLATDVPVEGHLADQLIVPLGIGAYLGSGGGALRTTALSSHATTNLEILRRFMDLSIEVHPDEDGKCIVRIG